MKSFIRLLPILFLFACSKVAYPVSLQWVPNNSNELVTAYKVYRVKGNSASLVATVSPPTTTVSVNNYLSGSRTIFYVTAVNAAGESMGSSQVTIQKH